MKRIATAIWIIVMSLLLLSVSAQADDISERTVRANIRTYVLESPSPASAFIRGYERGAEAIAYGRDADGTWLRILDGWVLAEVFRGQGDMAELPDVTTSINVTVTEAAQLYDGPSAKWFDVIGEIEADTKALAIGRNEGGSWLRLPQGWIEVAHVETNVDIRPLPVAPSGVIITAKSRTFILAEPDLGAEFVDVFEAGDEALAIGRSGVWLQIARGWVSVEAVEVSGDLSELPFAGVGFPVTVSIPIVNTREKPSSGTAFIQRLRRGDTAFALGRNASDNWLLTDVGWAHLDWVSFSEDIVDLPIIDSEFSATFTSRSIVDSTSEQLTPTPSARTSTRFDASAIRSLVLHHTEDIRILDIDIASNATTIEYDLKPWPFVPNETIANEVAFKIICAIRNGQDIPNTLKLIGQSHFKSDVGRKFTSPSVEIHISARNANRIVCRGNSYSDINWRSLASLYKSYPIPRGASVDYD